MTENRDDLIIDMLVNNEIVEIRPITGADIEIEKNLFEVSRRKVFIMAFYTKQQRHQRGLRILFAALIMRTKLLLLQL
ncbi:MAG: hypothetical protein ACI9FR_001171 [Cryomorphaceae bacterium]|jgi:hypothetical protein